MLCSKSCTGTKLETGADQALWKTIDLPRRTAWYGNEAGPIHTLALQLLRNLRYQLC